MAPPAWAYQVDNFTSPPDEELVCSICQNVFCDPVQSPCDHVFCRNCVSKWLESNRNCPICRKRATRSTLKEVVPIVKNMILKLTLRCHNYERGCGEIFTLEGCEAHSNTCPYELVQCKNKPCKSMLMRKEIKHHEAKDCSHIYVRCESCKLKVSFQNTETHNCILELRKKNKEKSNKMKKLSQRVKNLREELKKLKETDSDSYESSNMSEIIFDLRDSYNSFESSANDSEDQEDTWSGLGLPLVMSGIEIGNAMRVAFSEASTSAEAMQNISNSSLSPQSSNNTSIEYPRASSSISLNDSSILMDQTDPTMDIAENEVPQQSRRPTKRRLNTRFSTLSSTDGESQNESMDHAYPSRKRTLQLPSKVRAGSSTTVNAAGPSSLSSDTSSSASPNDSSSSNNTSGDRLQSQGQSRSADQLPAATSAVVSFNDSRQQNINPVFERTLSLLHQYTLESDPEWVPPNTNDSTITVEDSDSDPPYVLPGHITSSDESSNSDLDNSESSYEDAPEDGFKFKKGDFLESFYGCSDESDD